MRGALGPSATGGEQVIKSCLIGEHLVIDSLVNDSLVSDSLVSDSLVLSPSRQPRAGVCAEPNPWGLLWHMFRFSGSLHTHTAVNIGV